MADRKAFKLAPMHPAFSVMTWIYFFALAWLLATCRSGFVIQFAASVLGGVALLIWFWFRPSSFEVDEAGLHIRWPLRRRFILREDILSVEPAQIRQFGFMLRVGAGGLWGAFGYFYSFAMGGLDGYFSHTQGLVLIRMKHSRPLLITPERAEEFIKELQPHA